MSASFLIASRRRSPRPAAPHEIAQYSSAQSFGEIMIHTETQLAKVALLAEHSTTYEALQQAVISLEMIYTHSLALVCHIISATTNAASSQSLEQQISAFVAAVPAERTQMLASAIAGLQSRIAAITSVISKSAVKSAAQPALLNAEISTQSFATCEAAKWLYANLTSLSPSPLPTVSDPEHPTISSQHIFLARVVESLGDLVGNMVSHRGFHSEGLDRPIENTLQAMVEAWGSGVQFCECDIMLTADRQIVLAHDDTFERLSLFPESRTATTHVEELTYDDILRTPLKNGSRAPLLTSVLEAADSIGPHCGLVVEVKTSNLNIVPPLVDLLASDPSLLAHVPVIMCFHKDVINAVASQLRRALIARGLMHMCPKMLLLTEKDREPAEEGGRAFFDMGACATELAANHTRLVHSLPGDDLSWLDGLYVEYADSMMGSEWASVLASRLFGVWGNTDTLEVARLLKAKGANFVNSDFAPTFLE